jgi:hypothetical protein
VSLSIDETVSADACQAVHAPENFYDDMIASEELVVGETQEYCIQAFKTTVVEWGEGENEVRLGLLFYHMLPN